MGQMGPGNAPGFQAGMDAAGAGAAVYGPDPSAAGGYGQQVGYGGDAAGQAAGYGGTSQAAGSNTCHARAS